MIWLSTAGLAAGCLLAQRFKIIALVPATFVVVFIAVAVGIAQTSGVWSTILMMATTSVGLQIGYFLGMFIQYGLGALLARRSTVLRGARGAERRRAAVTDPKVRKKPKVPPPTTAESINVTPAGIPRATA
jgi:membrane protein DedA with SNARE-associated domain